MVPLCLVAAVGPYTWATGGWAGRALGDSLTLAGGLAFVTWLVSELRRRPSPQESPAALEPAADTGT
jgi:hypothetical protein